MASVGELAGLWAIFVPPGESGETLLVAGSAPLAMDGPRGMVGKSDAGGMFEG